MPTPDSMSLSTEGQACSPRATRPSRMGTRQDRTLGTPSTSHSHQPHWPVEHISPRGLWNRKLRERTTRSAASRATASSSPSTPSYARPSNVNRTVRPAGTPFRRAVTSADVEGRRAVDADALGLEIGVEAFHPELPPDAALLDATERALRQPNVVGVDPDVADTQTACHPDRSVDVPCPHGASEPEVTVVGERQRLGFRVERDHREDRPEDLLARDRHRRIDVVEDRRLHVVTVRPLAIDLRAAEHEVRAFRPAPFHVAEDSVELTPRHHGADLGRVVERRPDDERLGPLDESGEELIVYRALHEKPAAGGARLPCV